MQTRTTVQVPDWITEPVRSEIIFESAECHSGCTNPSCHYMHGDSWWVDGISYQTENEAEAALAKARGETI